MECHFWYSVIKILQLSSWVFYFNCTEQTQQPYCNLHSWEGYMAENWGRPLDNNLKRHRNPEVLSSTAWKELNLANSMWVDLEVELTLVMHQINQRSWTICWLKSKRLRAWSPQPAMLWFLTHRKYETIYVWCFKLLSLGVEAICFAITEDNI